MNLAVNVGMAVPALAFIRGGQTDHLEIIRVASQAVGLDYGHCALRQAQHLRFGSGGENIRVLHTVHALEREFGDRVVVWDVAVNADSDFTVAAPLP